jgi:peptidoglycan/xylan/chitin deacetylase (PgdA/CDA1 family)
VIALGVLHLPSGVFGRALIAGPADRPLVALTFDDGPDPRDTPRVLEVLARHGARATFFVIGERAARHGDLLGEMARQGHQIENHSYDHAYTTPVRGVARLRDDLLRTQEIIAAATGRRPAWFRPPVGLLSPRVAAAAAAAGLRLCGYGGKARDGLAGTTVDDALRHLLPALRPGAVLVLHDAAERGGRRPIAAEVLEALLPQLAARGLRPVTLAELLGP